MRKVLIVEDEFLEQEFLKTAVQRQLEPKDTILVCETGNEAIRMAKHNRPDIILMDILIPELDGLSAVEEIRKFLPDAYIVILSACCDFYYAQTAMNLNVQAYHLKPVKPSDFKEIFQKALSYLSNRQTEAAQENAVRKSEHSGDQRHFVSDAVRYINENFKEKLTLQMIASQVYMNPQYFSRVFKKEMGITCTNYVNKLKVEYACKLLETTNHHIYRVSSECGFTDPSYFNRVFLKQMGITPKEYKKNITAKKS